MDILDDIWKQDDHAEYPQKRMIHIFDIFGGSIGRYIQKKFSDSDIWKLKFSVVKERLQYSIQICNKWKEVCGTLTEKFWKTYHAHPWKDDKYIPDNLLRLKDRFEEVIVFTNFSFNSYNLKLIDSIVHLFLLHRFFKFELFTSNIISYCHLVNDNT